MKKKKGKVYQQKLGKVLIVPGAILGGLLFSTLVQPPQAHA